MITRFVSKLSRFVQYQRLELPHRLSAACSGRSGITQEPRNTELIVSLTTIPERIQKVHLCLESLLRQSIKPDRLLLWLSESHDIEGPSVNPNALPNSLTKLMKRGLEIHWCEDVRSYRKLIPTMKLHPRALIVTADDDIFYRKGWLKALYDAYKNEPQVIHCHRAHLMKYDGEGSLLPYRQWKHGASGFDGPSFDLFPTSGGGVLYAPGHLHPEILNEEAYLKLCPMADDVWQKAMSLLNGVTCKKVSKNTCRISSLRIPGKRPLGRYNVEEGGNDVQIQAVAKRYGVFASKGTQSARFDSRAV